MTNVEPTRTAARRLRRGATAAIAVLLIAAVAACSGGGGDDDAAGASSNDVACTPTTAASEGWVEPVVKKATPVLPVTTTDFTGEEVTVTDTSRILAVDTYGTLATTVYALGLGDSIVGRDVSTGIPALADLPVVTHNGHEL